MARKTTTDIAKGVQASPTSRKLPTINPSMVILDHEGFGWRQFLVRLPETAIADDLKEPGLWERVQNSALALRRHDHLYIVAFDESWAAEALVADATASAATLSKPRVTSLKARTVSLFEDDKYRVKWFGNGYAVERRADGMRISEITPSEAVAERDLARLYPRAR